MPIRNELIDQELIDLTKLGYTGGKDQTELKQHLINVGVFREDLIVDGVNNLWMQEDDQPVKSFKEALNTKYTKGVEAVAEEAAKLVKEESAEALRVSRLVDNPIIK